VSIINTFVPAFANFCKILTHTPSLLHRMKSFAFLPSKYCQRIIPPKGLQIFMLSYLPM
jgi:hypothetical protein